MRGMRGQSLTGYLLTKGIKVKTSNFKALMSIVLTGILAVTLTKLADNGMWLWLGVLYTAGVLQAVLLGLRDDDDELTSQGETA